MKQSLFFVIGFLVALSAKSDYLNWQVSSGILEGDNYLSGITFPSQSPDGWKGLAVVRYTTNYEADQNNLGSWAKAENAVMVDIDGKITGDYRYYTPIGEPLETESPMGSVDLAKIEGLDQGNTYFYIEVYRYNEAGYYEGVARSSVAAYSDLGIYVTNNSTIAGGTEPYEIWQGTGYSIPEPTSAMLLMIGLSLVGLKRKRA